MRTRRLFVSPEEISSGRIRFSPGAAHYLRNVLRLRPGDVLEVLDGAKAHLVRLDRLEGGEALGEVFDTRQPQAETQPHITLAFGCVRPQPFQEILRHCTEIGVSRFVPLLTSRSSRRPQDKKQRWDTVVASAAAQCGRPGLPVVEPPTHLEGFLSRTALPETRLIFAHKHGAPHVTAIAEPAAFARVVVLVGPEGGFESWEERSAMEAGFVPASLGVNTLRTETAAIVAVGVISSWFSSFGCVEPAAK